MSEEKSKVVRLRWKVSNNAAVAQRIRASVYGTEGREFESLQPHNFLGWVMGTVETSAGFTSE